ncbi:MAG: HD family hydrolase [bacterium]
MENNSINNPIITTFTGLQLEVNQPKISQICIEDIAHGLSQICRFAGQCSHFYSVAQHSVFVSQHVPKKDALKALLHDASEAYMGDLHSGLKKIIPQYKVIEDRLLEVIYKKFNLSIQPLKPGTIKHADELSLLWESTQLGMNIELDIDHEIPDRPIVHLNPKQASREFLNRFEELTQ